MNDFSDHELPWQLLCRFPEYQLLQEEKQKLMDQLFEVNKKLEKLEAVKSNFISNVKNEMNNPFSSIMGISANIQALCGPALGEQGTKIKSMAWLIHHEAFKLDFQLRNIFMAAEIEAGEAIPEVSEVKIAELIREVFDYCNQKIAYKRQNINFINNLQYKSDQIFRTDAAKLQLVLINVIHNAIEFSQEGCQIKVEAKIVQDQLEILIRDKGPGIDHLKKEEIYNRFNQLEDGLTRNHHGNGLGLSVTKALVEIINGTIDFYSETGRGTEFRITLREFDHAGFMSDLFMEGNELFSDEEERF